MSKLDEIAFVIRDGQIIKGKIRDFDGYIDETTTPQGIGPRFHVRDNELWSWGHAGNHPTLVQAYDTEAEAIEALEETFVFDFWNCPDILAFKSREKAEECLQDL